MGDWEFAAKSIREGVKIRRRFWTNGKEYIVWSIDSNSWRDHNGAIYAHPNFASGDWLEYVEPKEKVKLYNFAYKKSDWLTCLAFCKDELSFRDRYQLGDEVPVVRLEQTMIEVDDE